MLILDGRQIQKLLDTEKLIEATAAALNDVSAGRVSQPDRVATIVDDTVFTGLLDMPVYVPSTGLLISKLISVFPANADRGLAVRQAVVVVFDAETGTPTALLDGTELTAARTAACSALSARLLARPDAATVAILGTGVQARAHAAAMARALPIGQVRIAGRNHTTTRAAADELTSELGIPVSAASSYQHALEGADVVCGCTYTREPVIRREWLEPGVHVTSVGYHPDGREIDDDTIAAAGVFVESRHAAFAAIPPNLDLSQPVERALIAPNDATELGEVLAGTKPGRTSGDQITVYKSVGIAAEDAAAAATVLAAARHRNLGLNVPM